MNLTLNETEYQKEYSHILNISKINGLKHEIVRKKIEKCQRLKTINEIATLSSESPKKYTGK